jgi:hypothetical protein
VLVALFKSKIIPTQSLPPVENSNNVAKPSAGFYALIKTTPGQSKDKNISLEVLIINTVILEPDTRRAAKHGNPTTTCGVEYN